MNTQMTEKRRPRINWKGLYPQIRNKLKKVFDDNIYPTVLSFQRSTLQASAFSYQPLEAIIIDYSSNLPGNHLDNR
jgi:hypothetical protein